MGGECRAPIPIDERVDVVEAPKNVCSKHDRIVFIPVAINPIDEILHQRWDAIMLWWDMRADANSARAILARVDVKTSNRLKIESLNHMLGKEWPPNF